MNINNNKVDWNKCESVQYIIDSRIYCAICLEDDSYI